MTLWGGSPGKLRKSEVHFLQLLLIKARRALPHVFSVLEAGLGGLVSLLDLGRRPWAGALGAFRDFNRMKIRFTPQKARNPHRKIQWCSKRTASNPTPNLEFLCKMARHPAVATSHQQVWSISCSPTADGDLHWLKFRKHLPRFTSEAPPRPSRHEVLEKVKPNPFFQQNSLDFFRFFYPARPGLRPPGPQGSGSSNLSWHHCPWRKTPLRTFGATKAAAKPWLREPESTYQRLSAQFKNGFCSTYKWIEKHGWLTVEPNPLKLSWGWST